MCVCVCVCVCVCMYYMCVGGERAGREEGSKVEVYAILLLHGAYKRYLVVAA